MKVLIYIIYFISVHGSNALSVDERLSELEHVVKLQGVILEKHEKTIQEQNVIIKSYENENGELKLRVETLETDMAKFKRGSKDREVTSNQHILDKKNDQSKDFDEEHAEALRDGDQLDDINAVGNRTIQTSNRSRMVKRESPNIAFHTYVTGPRCFHEQQLIVFDTEDVDEGDGYSQTDGIYVVPVTGTYVFTWTVYSEFHQWFRADIIIDGVSKGWILADSDNDQATGIVIARVNAGSHVFIRRDKGDGCTLHDNLTRSTFSGWKLF